MGLGAGHCLGLFQGFEGGERWRVSGTDRMLDSEEGELQAVWIDRDGGEDRRRISLNELGE